MSPSLRETQLAMMNVLTARDGVAAAIGDAPGLERLVASDARLDAVGRLEIYADMYRERLRAALAATFPLIAKHLGPEGFAEMAEGYFAVYPSRSPSLRDCGAGFGAFLASRRAGWLSDLARLEWARHDVFDAADEPILDLASVQALGEAGLAELQLRLVAAQRRLRVAHAVVPAWRALADGADAGAPTRAPGTVLVWRYGVSVFHRALGDEEAYALSLAAGGLRFGALCETLDPTGDADAPLLAAELLLRWLTDGLLVGR